MADLRKHSSTSNLIRFRLVNSTTGVGLTGLTFSSTGLIISTIADNEATATTYTAAGSTIETITTLGTFAAPTATKCRFKEVDATNHKGLYEFQFADARFSVASAKRLVISVTGATSLLDAGYEVQLIAFDIYDAIPDVNVEEWNATAVPAEHTAGYPIITIKDGTGTGEINTNAGKVVGVELVDTLTTYTGNTPQTGDSFARLGAPAGASVSADILAIDNFVDGLETTIGVAGAGLTDLGGMSTTMKAQVQTEAEDALVVNNLDHLLKVAAVAGDVVDSSVMARLASKSATPAFTSFDNTTDSLEAIRDNQGGGSGDATIANQTDIKNIAVNQNG